MHHAAASLLECRGMHCAKALTLGPRSAIGIAAGAATVTAWRQEPQSGASNRSDLSGLRFVRQCFRFPTRRDLADFGSALRSPMPRRTAAKPVRLTLIYYDSL